MREAEDFDTAPCFNLSISPYLSRRMTSIHWENTLDQETSNLPAQIADALVSIPKALVPGVVKALDRLFGAAVDIPVAWLGQRKARIDAQTESYRLVEASIAQAAALGAGADPDTAERAMHFLVRKEYRKQLNREAVATAMVEDLREHVVNGANNAASAPTAEVDDDWLNVFERYAEDASSERLQGLWGRVLSGEVRKPGRFSTRTLRFLSEFSQVDALAFEIVAKGAFGDAALTSIVKPKDKTDIRDLIYLESSGLIQGASGLGLNRTLKLNKDGYGAIGEGELRLVFKGEANTSLVHEIIPLTPLGQELLCLVPSRNPRESARNVAFAMRDDRIHEAFLAVGGVGGKLQVMEVLWQKPNAEAQTVDGSTG